VSKASSAVTPGDSRQRPCLESMRSQYFESRSAATPSRFERQASTQSLSLVCSGEYRNGAVPWTTSTHEGPAAMLHKELYDKRISNICELTRT
jgi:hypothetical protein